MSMSFDFRASSLPADWNDDIRMNFLFSTFREKSVNPEGWEAKMKFWSNLIMDLCLENSVPMISHNFLCSALERKGKMPQCLNVVLDNMVNNGFLMPMETFNDIPSDKGWIGWGFNVLVQKPVSWGFSAIQSFLYNSNKKNDTLIVLGVVKHLAERIKMRYNELATDGETINILYLDHFEQQCKDICRGMEFNLAITQLQRDRLVYIFEDSGKKIIKFPRSGEHKVNELSELDKGILGLQKARDSVFDEIDKLEQDMKSCAEEARQFVRSGCKTKAMCSLKKKKRFEIMLKKKSTELDNIENLLCQLQNAGSEKMVLEAYRAGIKAIKVSVKKDLDLDKIDTTMSEVEEMMDEYKEIQQTMSKSVSPEDESLESFEDELNDLLQTGQAAKPTEVKKSSPSKFTDEEIIKRLAALRAPPEGVPPVKKFAMNDVFI